VFLVIAGSIAGEFEDFSGEIFENGSEVYCPGPDFTSQRLRERKRRVTDLVHRLQRVEHNCPSSTDDVHDRRGIGDRLSEIAM